MNASKFLKLFSIFALLIMTVCIVQTFLFTPANTHAVTLSKKKGKYEKIKGIDVCFCDSDSTECTPCMKKEDPGFVQ